MDGTNYLKFLCFPVVSGLSLEFESVDANEFSCSKETSYSLMIQKCISEIKIVQKYLIVNYT